MENKHIVIAVIGFLAVVFVLPLIVSAATGGSSGAGSTSTSAPTSSQASAPPVPSAPPELTEADLIGSQWQVPTDRGILTVELNAGGKAQAKVPESIAGMVRMMTGSDVVQGQWSVSGGTLTVTASAMGQTQTVNCQISGDQVYYEGNPVTRLR